MNAVPAVLARQPQDFRITDATLSVAARALAAAFADVLGVPLRHQRALETLAHAGGWANLHVLKAEIKKAPQMLGLDRASLDAAAVRALTYLQAKGEAPAATPEDVGFVLGVALTTARLTLSKEELPQDMTSSGVPEIAPEPAVPEAGHARMFDLVLACPVDRWNGRPISRRTVHDLIRLLLDSRTPSIEMRKAEVVLAQIGLKVSPNAMLLYVDADTLAAALDLTRDDLRWGLGRESSYTWKHFKMQTGEDCAVTVNGMEFPLSSVLPKVEIDTIPLSSGEGVNLTELLWRLFPWHSRADAEQALAWLAATPLFAKAGPVHLWLDGPPAWTEAFARLAAPIALDFGAGQAASGAAHFATDRHIRDAAELAKLSARHPGASFLIAGGTVPAPPARDDFLVVRLNTVPMPAGGLDGLADLPWARLTLRIASESAQIIETVRRDVEFQRRHADVMSVDALGTLLLQEVSQTLTQSHGGRLPLISLPGLTV